MLHVVDGINEAMGLRPGADALAAQLAALAAAAAQIPLRVPPVSTALATARRPATNLAIAFNRGRGSHHCGQRRRERLRRHHESAAEDCHRRRRR